MNISPKIYTRRKFIPTMASMLAAACTLPKRLGAADDRSLPNQLYTTEDVTHGKRVLFDGKTLKGWRAVPRLEVGFLILQDKVPVAQLEERGYAHYRARPESKKMLEHTGRWEVIDGAIVGGQQIEGMGAYLITEEKFGDFELEFESNNDWPVDSGVLVRQNAIGPVGYQIGVEPRPRGNIGGYYVNGIGSFRSAPFYVDALELPGFKYTQLTQGVHDSRPFWPLDYAAHFEDFVQIWRPNDWNRFRVRCVGKIPTMTTWINGMKIASLNFASVRFPTFNPALATEYLGQPGHIGLEVHSSGPGGMGRNRWAPGAVTRWRNLTIQPL